MVGRKNPGDNAGERALVRLRLGLKKCACVVFGFSTDFLVAPQHVVETGMMSFTFLTPWAFSAPRGGGGRPASDQGSSRKGLLS